MGNRILVVDDEKEIADVIELYLKNEGFEVEKFYTGKDALVSIEKAAPDMALLDVMLPDIDGFQILKKIREKYTFPVIMLTAKTEYMDKITGLTLGADDICRSHLTHWRWLRESRRSSAGIRSTMKWVRMPGMCSMWVVCP